MTKKLFASLSILFFATSGGNTKPLDKKDFYLASCYILNSDFEIVRQLSPGWVCQVKPDGGWLASDNKTLFNYNSDGSILWKKDGVYHHQIKLWNNKSVLVLTSESHTVNGKLVRFDAVQMLNLDDGSVQHQFSSYDEIYKTQKLKNSAIDGPLYSILPLKDTNAKSIKVEKSHWNAISFFNNEIIINELRSVAFALNKNLQFVRFIPFSKVLGLTNFLRTHDFQVLGEDHFLFFNNQSTTRKTYSVYEIKNGSLVFNFPNKKIDFEPVRCCGGVQKFENEYLVGFPAKDINENYSTVGLISNDGNWLIKKRIRTRIQDIRKIPYSDFLKKNKIR